MNKIEKIRYNKLYFGDCKEILKTFQPKEHFNLIYIDPPFFSNKYYEVIWNDGTEIRAFEDRWKGGIDHYIGWMEERIKLINDNLKEGGIFLLHCNWKAIHYLKCLCDKIFGYNNFINEIIWYTQLGGSGGRTSFKRKHQTILVYTKRKNNNVRYTFNPLRGEITPQMKAKYCHKDKKGFYMISKGKKYYLKGGKLQSDVFFDIPKLSPTSSERKGYPTQKPQILLERLIKCYSNENDLIGDFFCGGGTTLIVAKKNNRRFVGIDVSPTACMVSCNWLKFSEFNIVNYPYTSKTIEKLTPLEYQAWIMRKLHGKDYGVDKNGIDGSIPIWYGFSHVPVQVKNHQVSRKDANHFIRSIKRSRFNKKKAIIVGHRKNNTNPFSKGVFDEIAIVKREGLIIDLIEGNNYLVDQEKIDSYLKGNKKRPKIKILKTKERSLGDFV